MRHLGLSVVVLCVHLASTHPPLETLNAISHENTNEESGINEWSLNSAIKMLRNEAAMSYALELMKNQKALYSLKDVLVQKGKEGVAALQDLAYGGLKKKLSELESLGLKMENVWEAAQSVQAISDNLLAAEGAGFDTMDKASSNTSGSVWMAVKSTWQRVLAYIEEENSMPLFLQLTPVRVINRLMSLGDDVSLVSFLTAKLKPDLREFLSHEIDPYLGPARDLNSIYAFARNIGVGGVVDYVTSPKFRHTFDVMSRVASAYLDDTVSDDVVDGYIDVISFGHPELRQFYHSFVQSQRQVSGRHRREVLHELTFRAPDTNATHEPRQYGTRYGVPMVAGYDPARDGYGYGGGGGGYGGGNSLDPYVILGSLALGTILGFLLFRALRGTGNGRRDIGDGSLSLWLSDVPGRFLSWGDDVARVRRRAKDFSHDGDEFNLPESLRGDVWAHDPLLDDTWQDEDDEDDVAEQLNQLWDVFQRTNNTSCVQAQLCGAAANATAQTLTGRTSGTALLLASVSSLMGVAGSGQLLDDVSSTLVNGQSYSCTITSCVH